MTNVKVIASSLRIRKSPSTKSDVLGSLPFGTIVEIDSKTNGWYKLANSDGFISAEYVEVVGDAPVETETTPTAMTIEQRLSVLEEKLSAMEAVVYGDQ